MKAASMEDGCARVLNGQVMLARTPAAWAKMRRRAMLWGWAFGVLGCALGQAIYDFQQHEVAGSPLGLMRPGDNSGGKAAGTDSASATLGNPPLPPAWRDRSAFPAAPLADATNFQFLGEATAPSTSSGRVGPSGAVNQQPVHAESEAPQADVAEPVSFLAALFVPFLVGFFLIGVPGGVVGAFCYMAMRPSAGLGATDVGGRR